jgi:RNA recognition motif-containing protein
MEVSMSPKIYVGNIGHSINNQQLAARFAKYGAVKTTKIITDRESGKSKGFAFIEMSSGFEAARAIQALNGTEIEGRVIKVIEARPREASSSGFVRF